MKCKGFFAWLLSLAPAPVLAKGKPEPRFPRYFAFQPSLPVYLRVDATDRVVRVSANGREKREGVRGSRPPNMQEVKFFPLTLDDVERGVWQQDHLREITATEAEALLKPKET